MKLATVVADVEGGEASPLQNKRKSYPSQLVESLSLPGARSLFPFFPERRTKPTQDPRRHRPREIVGLETAEVPWKQPMGTTKVRRTQSCLLETNDDLMASARSS